jgi:pimeloyl-ACP methyl ester carboxylesterase
MWLALALGAAVALTAGLVYQHLGGRRDAACLPPPGHLVDVDGRRLHVFCIGSGPVSVIFESGLAASSLNWRPVQEQVAAFARACAYDRAGYGWSDRAPGSRTARASAADLGKVVGAAGVPPPYVLVAHSFGAYVATLFATEHPGDVAGLVLVDPLTAGEWLTPDTGQRRIAWGGRLFSTIGAALAGVGFVRFLLARTGDGGSSVSGIVLRSFGREADAAVRRVVGEVTKMPRELWPAVRAHWSRASGFLAMAQHFRALEPSAAEVSVALTSSTAAAVFADLPVIVISAFNCPDVRRAAHRDLSGISECGQHLTATTGGHWIHLDQPAVVVDAIRFLVDRAAAMHTVPAAGTRSA